MSPINSPSPSPARTPFRRRTKTCARRCERGCCTIATYFPLAFVYSLTTWAVFVEAGLGLRSSFSGQAKPWTAHLTSATGVTLYLLLNTCYTVAVFTDPGSPLQATASNGQPKYSSLPSFESDHDPSHIHPITVSSTGAPRYCKKCQTLKPDRTHHCSTCRRCVLKMDHHCPWLATCLGLHNYKAFVLFLVYTTVFCWVCFMSTAYWVWTEVFDQNQYLEEFAPVNVILLAVVSGIIGLVLTGFTSWHLYLCIRGQTTIESLEKTRYLGAVRRQVERQRQEQLQNHRHSSSHGVAETLQRAGEQILEFHANAVPGATRLEEGEERTSPTTSVHPGARIIQTGDSSDDPVAGKSPAEQALRRTYSSMEQQRERDRYEEYEDDRELEKLPNAFDLGWRQNLSHLFGPKPLLWALPICNTTGDGRRWEVSPKWIQAREEAARGREARHQRPTYKNENSRLRSGMGFDGADSLENGYGYPHDGLRRALSQNSLSMQTLKRPGHAWVRAKQRRDFDQAEIDGEVDQYEVSSDEETDGPWRNDPNPF